MISRLRRLPIALFDPRTATARRFPYFTVKHMRNGMAENRVGVVVGKSVDRRATRRNLLRRRILAAARQIPPRGVDLLFVVAPAAKDAGREAWGRALRDVIATFSR